MKKKLLQVYVTEEQSKRIRSEASRLGLSISGFLKQGVLRTIKKEEDSQE